jgi:hypothetical protein
MPDVNLTDDELLLLDGQCSPAVQAEVEIAKDKRALVGFAKVSGDDAEFISRILAEAREQGRLDYRRLLLRHCPICKAMPGYKIYKSGPNKGRENYDKPLYLGGVDLAHRFVHVTGHAARGCCVNCWQRIQPVLAAQLVGVRAAIPAEISGEKPRFARYARKKCEKCGWIGHDGQLGKLRTLLGDGYYPGKCPACGAENHAFTVANIVTLEGFEVVEVGQ